MNFMKKQKMKINASATLLLGGALIFSLLCFACGKESSKGNVSKEQQSLNASLKAAYEKNFVSAQIVKEQGEKMWGSQYPRRLPLLEINTDTVLKGQDFGLIANTQECMTDKFNALLRAAAAKAPCKVILQKGVYNLKKPFPNSNYALSLNGLKDVHLIGSG